MGITLTTQVVLGQRAPTVSLVARLVSVTPGTVEVESGLVELRIRPVYQQRALTA